MTEIERMEIARRYLIEKLKQKKERADTWLAACAGAGAACLFVLAVELLLH